MHFSFSYTYIPLSYFLIFNCVRTHFLLHWSNSYFFLWFNSLFFCSSVYRSHRWLSWTMKETSLLLPLANGIMTSSWALEVKIPAKVLPAIYIRPCATKEFTPSSIISFRGEKKFRKNLSKPSKIHRFWLLSFLKTTQSPNGAWMNLLRLLSVEKKTKRWKFVQFFTMLIHQKYEIKRETLEMHWLIMKRSSKITRTRCRGGGML